MAEQTQQQPRKQEKAPAPPKFRKFEAPNEDLEPFGVQTQREDYIDGVVESPKVRALLDLFGLQDRSEVVFPFQHMKRAHGELWSMRIEPAQDHIVAGAHIHGHRWIYKRELPETNAGVQ